VLQFSLAALEKKNETRNQEMSNILW